MTCRCEAVGLARSPRSSVSVASCQMYVVRWQKAQPGAGHTTSPMGQANRADCTRRSQPEMASEQLAIFDAP
jgi:hypothetical protein